MVSLARLERALIESGLSHAILRPTVLFGLEDILINNITWALRHFPVFGVFGDGGYRLQPIYVDAPPRSRCRLRDSAIMIPQLSTSHHPSASTREYLNP